jgi:AcrR family transcriptional regulator
MNGSLSREGVLRAAVELADARGLDALSMRNLARAMGVGAMSLYYYVANKSDLLDGIVDLVIGEIDLPSASLDWREALRHTARSAHRALSRHPWAAGLVLSSPSVQAARLRYMEALLGTLRTGGFSAELTHRAYHVLDSYIVGFTLWQVGMNLPADTGHLVTGFLQELPVDRFPFVAEHAQQHLKPADHEAGSDFDFGLDLILAGLERLDGAVS